MIRRIHGRFTKGFKYPKEWASKRKRPRGLHYSIKNTNRAWFKKGETPPSFKLLRNWWDDKNNRKMMSLRRKGKRVSPSTEFKRGDKRITGRNSNNWKGGITPVNQKIRHSFEYKLWRTSVFVRDNYTCIWCGQKGGKLNADHIKRFSDYPELRFAIDNGRTLCVPCHKKTDTYLQRL